MENIIEKRLFTDQYGFRNNTGKERQLSLTIVKVNWMAFVDLEDAFSNVQWNNFF